MAGSSAERNQDLIPIHGEFKPAIPSDPVTVLAAGVTAEANFAAALAEVDKIQDLEERARAYLTITQGYILGGKDSTNTLGLAKATIGELKKQTEAASHKETQSSRTEELQVVTRLLLEQAFLEVKSGGNPAQTIQETHAFISGYYYNIEPGWVNDSLRSNDLTTWTNRVVAQASDLADLTIFLLNNPNVSYLKPEDLILEINDLANNEIFVKATTPSFHRHGHSKDRAGVLNTLIRLQVFTGDYEGAQESLKALNGIKTTPWVKGTFDESEGARKAKIDSFTLAGAILRQVAAQASQEDFEGIDYEAILASENMGAVTGLAYYEMVDLDSTLERDDLSAEVKNALITGAMQKLEDQEQQMRTKRKLLDSKRTNASE